MKLLSTLLFLVLLVSCKFSSEESSTSSTTTTAYNEVDEFNQRLEGKADEYLAIASGLLDEFNSPDAKIRILKELKKLDFFAWKFSNYELSASYRHNSFSVSYGIKLYSDPNKKRVLEIEIDGIMKRKVLD